MDELFVATGRTNVPIEPDVAKKYNLSRGMKTPFSGSVIVDKNSDATPKPVNKQKSIEEPTKPEPNFTTAEMFDIAAGEDS